MKSIFVRSGISCMMVMIAVMSMAQSTQKASFKVQGNCGMCKQNIESSLKISGVEAAQWNPDTKMLKVKFDAAAISLDSIQHRIAEAGYDTDKFKANDSTYQHLVKCCQYRKGEK